MILGGVIFFLIRDFPKLDDGHPGPALFPGILAGLFIVFGVFLLVQGIRTNSLQSRSRNRRDDDDSELTPSQLEDVNSPAQGKTRSFEGIVNAFCVIASIVFYIYFVDRLGFLITGFLLSGFLMIKLGVKGWKSGVISVLSTFLIYILFAKILRVPLPWGLLSW